jgi:hypothetical protein
MTEPSSPPPTVPSAAGPTPEEISARLEALLKRTQALRETQRPIGEGGGPLPWPPSDGELDALELVDVPPEAARGPEPSSAPAVPASGEAAAPVLPADKSASTFARPDWTSLRLRDPLPAPSRTPGWMWLAVAALVVALGVETAYLLHTAPWSAPTAGSSGSLTLEGDERVRARIDNGAAERLPVQREVAAGGQLRVVVELAETAGATAADSAVDAPAPNTAGSPRPGPPPPTGDGAGVPAIRPGTTGSVLIETTPPGALVTMEGRERGRTPLTIDGLRPGRHDVLVAGASGIVALKVDVVAGETTRLDASRP